MRTILFIACILFANFVFAGNGNSKFSSNHNVNSRGGSTFSSGRTTAFGVGNGTGSGGGNGSSGNGVDNGNSNAGGQGNGGGATVPIGSGLWMLIIGSGLYLGRKTYIEIKKK